MSSFVTKDVCINQIVTWIQRQPRESVYRVKLVEAFILDPLNPGWADISRAMWELNVRVVRERYADADKSGMVPEKFTPRKEFATAIQVYKSLKCWLYQCSDAHDSSILYTVMKGIADCLAHDIICALPEYKNAFWDRRGEGAHKLIH